MTDISLYNSMGLDKYVQPLNKKLDKKMFYDQADLNKKEKNLLQKQVEKIELSYLLVPSTINIQPYISEDYRYEGVMFITIHVRSGVKEHHIKGLSHILHTVLPHPAVLVFAIQDDVRLVTAQKRLNKVDQSKVVVEESHDSGWFSLASNQEVISPFLEAIHLSRLSFNNFFEFYQGIHKAIEALRFALITGQFIIIDNDTQRQLLNKLAAIQADIERYKHLIKKESQFNRRVEYNITIHRLSEELITLKRELEKEVDT